MQKQMFLGNGLLILAVQPLALVGAFTGEAAHFDSPIKHVYDVSRFEDQDLDDTLFLDEDDDDDEGGDEADDVAYIDIAEDEVPGDDSADEDE